MNQKALLVIGAVILIILAVLAVRQILYLRWAHASFENYYAFRGCVSLISSTTDSGTCKLANGQTIKIVEYNGKWYLDGDLPGGFLNW